MERRIRKPFFRWIIQLPFLPESFIRTSFFVETRQIETQWHVTLTLLRRQYTFCRFSVLLELDVRGDTSCAVTVEELNLNIYLNNEWMNTGDTDNYEFCSRNRYTYHLEVAVEMKPQMEPHDLEIVISFSGMRHRNIEENPAINTAGLLYGDEDLIALSRDLEQLAMRGHYSNMVLVSADEQIFRAHSYIIEKRWNNFGPRSNSVRLPISGNVLFDILRYIYCGKFPTDLPLWSNPRYTAELFQVINLYKMYHLYSVFIKGDSYHVQQTQKHVISRCYLLKLHLVDNQPITEESIIILFEQHHRTTPGNQQTNLDLVFQVQARNWNQLGGLFLSIALQSTNLTVVYCVLTVERAESITEITEENQTDYDWEIVTTCVWAIQPQDLKNTGPLIYLNDPRLVAPPFPVVYCRINISYTDGTTLTHVRGYGGTVQDELIRYNILSDHMFQLQRNLTSTDLCMVCRNLSPQVQEVTENMHKAIFVTRVPQWRSVLSDIHPRSDLADTVSADNLSHAAMLFVKDYIYTGKMRRFPTNILREITKFANDGRFDCLRDFLATQNIDPVIE